MTGALEWTTALLVAALAAAVGLQVVGRHVFHTPLPWTEEIARLLLVWLMCLGGIGALERAEHPRVTVLVRRLAPERREAVERGLQLVLLGFFACLVVLQPTWTSERVEKTEGELAIIVDASRSMSVRSQGRVRYDRVRALLERFSHERRAARTAVSRRPRHASSASTACTVGSSLPV